MVMQGIERCFPILARNTERKMTCAHALTGLVVISRKTKTKTEVTNGGKGEEERRKKS
jgi:hypothetical protein